MRITDLISKQAIALGQRPQSKEEAFQILIDLHVEAGNISNKEEFRQGILEREAKGTTAIGEGLAIPHAKNKAVLRPSLAVMTVPDGVDCQSMDQAPSRLFFMIAAPESGQDVHLEVLANLNMMLMDENFRKQLLAAKNKDELIATINSKEIEKFGEPKELRMDTTKENQISKKGYRILAVTACPTGIAHTFMAAEALTLKGKELGYELKAETNGSGGVKNALTKEEIKAADGIIIAADKNVDMARFDGKRVLKVKVADGIHKPQELIEKIVKGEASVYHHVSDGNEVEHTASESVGRQIYKHLMNGVSHMLPFVIGGGILIALAFLFDNYSIDPKNFGSNTPFAAFLMRVGKTAFNFMLPVLAGYIAMSIADRPGLAVGFVGGAIASSGMTLTASEGVSAGFLGALIAGFLGGYLVQGIKKLSSYLPESLEGIKPVLIYPLFGVLSIGVVMGAITPAVGDLNTALANGLNAMGGGSKILLGCVLGGMMAIDMGGPFNKAAYVFGTASIANGNFDIMAAVMVGGMIPPLAIALSTTLFRDIWSESERKSGVVNYIMGLCFISEGAIPFAAADPLRIIPSCIIGSAVAGGISMAVGATLRAPHGGIFVFPLIGNVLGYIIALIVGSVVGMALITILKKTKKTTN